MDDRTLNDPANHIEMETLHEPEQQSHNNNGVKAKQKDYFVGIGLLLVVVLLWTLSNFVTQDLYEGGYDKPFLVTYTNTAAFSFYLIPLFIRRLRSRNDGPISTQERIDAGYQPLNPTHDSQDSTLPLESVESLAPLSVRETLHLALAFYLIWFTANWTLNASLGYTSVASTTVLSSMSGFFTLGLGWFSRVETITLLKVATVCTSFVGVLLVSLSDSTSSTPKSLATRSASAPAKTMDSNAALGDFLAIASALFFASYVILLKVRIKLESRIDMQLFFGFVGLVNVLTCWPIGLLLHLTGFEVFELPPSRKAWQALLINMVITFSSDYLYVLAMLKTTPLVVTIGLSLTIPVAVAGDFLLLRPVRAQVIAGALLVFLSFVAIGIENSKEEKRAIRTTIEQ